MIKIPSSVIKSVPFEIISALAAPLIHFSEIMRPHLKTLIYFRSGATFGAVICHHVTGSRGVWLVSARSTSEMLAREKCWQRAWPLVGDSGTRTPPQNKWLPLAKICLHRFPWARDACNSLQGRGGNRDVSPR